MPQLRMTEAIEGFLKTVPINYAEDLTCRCTGEMECQLMVDPTEGEPVYDGERLIRNTWSITPPDMTTYTFHHVRIPKNAMSDPYYNDPTCDFPLMRHVECIGMTGWNWKQKKSMWVAFDFDAITGHAAGVGVSDDALRLVKDAASKIPWVQVRRSTGGAGLHLYVFFDPDDAPDTPNHNVHAALARAVLGMMEREAGFDFRGNMDVLGGNMWVWHRKISDINRGLSIIKDYEDFCPQLPDNWLDNLDVVMGTQSKIKFRGINDNDYDAFESQASSRMKVELDEVHKLIEERVHTSGYTIVWVPDHHCWQTHSKAFEKLLEDYPGEYSGVYRTLSDGGDPGKPNCFAFPLPNGGLRITRFGRGAREHDIWHQDGNDWTWTYFNRPPSLMEAASIYGGAEDPDGKGWVFTDFADVQSVIELLGDELRIEESWLEIFGSDPRNITLRPNKQKQLVIEIDKKKDDKAPKGWIEKGRKFIHLSRNARAEPIKEEEEVSYDDRIRALVDVGNEFSQWVVLNDDGEWVGHNKDNTRSALRIHAAGDDIETVLGRLIIKNWKMVNVPFQPEYLGHRRWNRHAPQFTVTPGESGQDHPHWDMVMDHCGQDLDSILKEDKWCREAGIHTGADYLRYWCSFMFRDPYCKLPYLFMYGPQNSGKSIFHEALSLLTTRGVVLADEALKNKSGFNGELAGAVLCVVEETNLSPNGTGGRIAYDRMKSWVTGEQILVHAKYQQPYQLKNTTHWCQMANDKSYVPIFPGDTRVVMMYVPMIDDAEIPKDTLLEHLKVQAPAFLRTLLDLKLPSPPGRMRLPVLETESKRQAEESVHSLVYKFVQEKCHQIDGAFVKLKDFYTAFTEWVPEDSKYEWTYNRVIDEFRTREMFPFGRYENNVTCIGNISLEPRQEDMDYGGPFVRFRQKLLKKD
jgi:hypothetical protein